MKRKHSNEEFKATHGTNPKGYGMWLFDVTVYAEGRGYTSLGVKGANGMFSWAKKTVQDEAVAEARSIGGATLVMTETQG